MKENKQNNENIIVKNCDCFDFLPTLQNNSIDLILIDPPYLISRETNFQSGDLVGDERDRFRVSMDFGKWDKINLDFDKIFKELYRVLKPSGTIIVFWDLWKLQDLSKL